MELRQLRYLIAVAEEASFTRGAARVHVAQPAVSQQIAQLERELGDKLFDRSDRQVHLTPAGEAFLPYARAALDAALDGRDAIVSMRGVLTGQLAVGTIQSPPEFMIRMLGEFQRLHSASGPATWSLRSTALCRRWNSPSIRIVNSMSPAELSMSPSSGSPA